MFSNRDLKKLLIPLVVEQILTALMGTMDTMMVARVSSAAISGVSIVDSINKLVIFLFGAMATGGTIICSQYIGHRDRQAANNAGRQVLLSSLALSVIVAVLCFLLRRFLLKLIFGTVEADVMANAVSYFSIVVLGYPFLTLFSAGAALYRAGGNSRLPMIVSIVSNAINIAGNALLIFVFHLGAAGAAIATVFSQFISAVVILVCLRRPGQVIDVGPYLRIRPDLNVIWRVLCVGIPTGVENAMFQFGKLIVQSTVSTLGTVAMASNALVVTVELFSSMPSMAIGQGLVTVAGQCVGAGRIDEARGYIKKLTLWSGIVLLIANWALYFATPLVTKAAGAEPEVAKLTLHTVFIISLVKPFIWNIAFTPGNGMRAAGDVRYSMILSTVSMWIFRVGLSTVLCRVCGVGLIGIWCGYFADWTCRTICFHLRFRSDKWHSHSLI